MEQVTIKFDRVFSVQRQDGGNSKYTVFGFESNGRRYFEVTVPGWPALENGMVVTALIRKNGDWNSIFGWANQATGEVVIPRPGKTLKSGIHFIGLGAAAVIWGGVFFPHKTLISFANYSAAAIAFVFGFIEILKSHRENKELLIAQAQIASLGDRYQVAGKGSSVDVDRQ